MWSSEAPHSSDLLDLKLMPAWVKETETKSYEHYTGDEGMPREGRRGPGKKRPPRDAQGPRFKTGETARPSQNQRDRGDRRRPPRGKDNRPSRPQGGRQGDRPRQNRPPERRPQQSHPPVAPPDIAIRFLPRTPVFDNVVEQIRSGPVAYSLFHLARLFLEKPERYEVRLIAKPETPLYQLGEEGAVSLNREFLEHDAFRLARDQFYKIEITQGEPIKGNFTSLARDPLSRTLLGPTNYHGYQPRLRTLYEQRFSRRMAFPEFQRKIEIVSDSAVIEKWKEDARKVTTYSTLRPAAAGPQTFSSPTEVEKHFEKNYLPNLVRTISEIVIDGPESRHMQDRVLTRLIETEWNREMKSPSPMMQELANRFREVALYVFRHRKGMLFVTSVYPRPFTSEQTAVSSQVRTIVDAIAGSPRIGRKELADKLIVDLGAEEAERAKMALASDLLWLISSGHVIEFNDGSLDLPRAKAKPKDQTAAEKEERVEAGAPPAEEEVKVSEKSEDVVAAAVSAAEPDKQELGTSSSTTAEEAEIGGS